MSEQLDEQNLPGVWTMEQRLRRLAGLRQGVINKLDKRVSQLEDENRRLRAELGRLR